MYAVVGVLHACRLDRSLHKACRRDVRDHCSDWEADDDGDDDDAEASGPHVFRCLYQRYREQSDSKHSKVTTPSRSHAPPPLLSVWIHHRLVSLSPPFMRCHC